VLYIIVNGTILDPEKIKAFTSDVTEITVKGPTLYATVRLSTVRIFYNIVNLEIYASFGG